MKLDKKVLKALIKESLQEAKHGHLESIPGGGEGSGVATGMLEAVDSFKKTLQDNANKLEEMRKQNEEIMKGFQEVQEALKAEIERIAQEEFARKNRPEPSAGPNPEDIEIPT